MHTGHTDGTLYCDDRARGCPRCHEVELFLHDLPATPVWMLRASRFALGTGRVAEAFVRGIRWLGDADAPR